MGEGNIPSRDAHIDAVFGATGYLSKVFDGYTPRPGQVALAHAVDHALAERTHLLAEGPTGTGKSLAYAAPASYHAAITGQNVVIVTANIALQEQIVNKDLPLLRSIVPWPFTFALLKGRNNYLCVDRYYQEAADRMRTDLEAQGEDRKQLPVVREWARESIRGGVGAETGDMSELPFEPSYNVWRRFSVGSDECKKSRCKMKHDCFANAALERGRTAKVIVTNYHMLYAHLSVYMTAGFDAVLPPFHVAILDEVHKAPDIARDFFGFKLGPGAVRNLSRKLRKIAGEDNAAHRAADELDRACGWFFNQLSALKHDGKRYKARLTGEFSRDELGAFESMDAALGVASSFFKGRCDALSKSIAEHSEEGGGLEAQADEMNDELGQAENDRDRASEIRAQIKTASEPLGKREVFFVEEDERSGNTSLCSKLVYPADALRPGLWDKQVIDRERGVISDRITVVGTSATLATDGGSFDFAAEELGVEDYDELVAESPFRWPEQCLFIVPEGMPDPNDPEFRAAMAKVVERTVLLAGGRTLGLFTSRRNMEHTHDAIVGTCRTQGYTLLKQGDAPRTKLIERFKTDETSVLLGTESFWAGVDVPGPALSVVVIDRLPFPTPDDPVMDAIATRDDAWFWKYAIPRSIIAFKQGFGRLIRSLGDRGVVVCCDNRIVKKRYGKQYLRALPPVPKSTRIEALADWLNPPPPLDPIEV